MRDVEKVMRDVEQPSVTVKTPGLGTHLHREVQGKPQAHTPTAVVLGDVAQLMLACTGPCTRHVPVSPVQAQHTVGPAHLACGPRDLLFLAPPQWACTRVENLTAAGWAIPGSKQVNLPLGFCRARSHNSLNTATWAH